MKRLKRRAAAARVILLMLTATAGVCLYIRKDAPRAMRAEAAQAVAAAGDPVTRFRTEREELRSREVSQLNDIIHDASSDGETVNRAQRQLMDLMKAQEREHTLEGLLNMRGFEGALVTVSDASVNVVLRGDTPTQRQSALILDLVLRETGVTAGNVKILSINQ